MRHRALNFLLLASLLFWTTGAALFLHERFEHPGHDDGSVATAGPATASDHVKGSQDSKHKNPHNHDDCPTCQLLAHMRADRGPAPTPICLHERHDYTLRLIDRRPPVIDSLTFAPIRGPPAIA